jgi:hypothetical protein
MADPDLELFMAVSIFSSMLQPLLRRDPYGAQVTWR